MKNKFIPYLILSSIFLSFILSGCGIVDVSINTKVYENGSFDREITYKATNDTKLLKEKYILPQGENWQITEDKQYIPKGKRTDEIYTYTAKGHFNYLESDYAKADFNNPPRYSKNLISIQSTPEYYLYQETFSDTVDKEKFKESIETSIKDYVSAVFDEFKKTIFSNETTHTINSIQAKTRDSMLAYFDEIWKGFESITTKEDMDKALKLINETENIFVNKIDNYWKKNGHNYLSTGSKEKIKNAWDEWDEKNKDNPGMFFYSADKDMKLSTGAYDLNFFSPNYTFEVSVTMPANIVKSNAHQVQGNKASWKFTPAYFMLKDYTLVAKSNK